MATKKITDFTFDAKNANRGSERGAYMLERSLEKFGAGRSILVDKHGTVIAGNKTLAKAGEMGLEDVIVVQTNGDKVVAVQRMDLDLAKDERARELAFADNRVSEISLEWDADQILQDIESGLDISDFFKNDEVEKIMAQANGHVPEQAESIPSDVEKRTEPSDLWKLGDHRLLCGDAEAQADVERLMDGATPNLMVTDPPYGVNYDPEWRTRAAEKGLIGFATRREGKVQNDDRIDWTEAWRLSTASVAYVWHAGRYASEVQATLESAGYEARSQIIWSKDSFSISRGHYHWQHEPCWYAVKKGEAADWIGDRSQSTVWEIAKNDGMDQGNHGTQKPIECMQRPIRNHSGDVYDPFVGSGTTIIASEILHRTCYAMDIDPHYCDVAIQRWETFTGEKAEKL